MPSPSSASTSSEFLRCTITRRQDGLEFRLFCPLIENAFRLLSNGRTRSESNGNRWSGASYYVVEYGPNGIPTALPGFTAGRFDMWGSRELLLRQAPLYNLSMLLAVGLGNENGVVVSVPTVISETTLNNYSEGFKSAVRQFYIDFLRESERTIRITTEELVA